MLSSVAPNIIFGAGKPQKCLKVTTLRNIGDCLVVAGTLGLIAGREWLKKKRAIMDFGEKRWKFFLQASRSFLNRRGANKNSG